MQTDPTQLDCIYFRMLKAGVQISNHYSDLYAQVTPVSTQILKDYPSIRATTFINSLDGKLWYDIPFQFSPYWLAKKKDNVPDSDTSLQS